jgi:hypothetical protein
MTGATEEPRCSSAIFADAGVLPLKNVTQDCLICCVAGGAGPAGAGEDAPGDGAWEAAWPEPAEDEPPQLTASSATVTQSSPRRSRWAIRQRAMKHHLPT